MHDFHIVMNEEMRQEIQTLATDMGVSRSGAVIFILNTCSSFLETRHFAGMTEALPTRVNWTRQFHIYFDEDDEQLYHTIKAIHKNLDTHSMAQIIRFVISYFLDGVRYYGSIEAFVQVLEGENFEWENYRNTHPVIQVVNRTRQLFGENMARFQMEYNEAFELLSTTVLLE